jgi:hypothetical protein
MDGNRASLLFLPQALLAVAAYYSSWAGRAAGLGNGLLIIRAASLGTLLGMEK